MSLAALARETGLLYSTAYKRARVLAASGRPVTAETLLGFARRKPSGEPLPNSLMEALDRAVLPYGGHLPAVLGFIEGMRSGPHRG